MKAQQLIKQIKARTGPVTVGVINGDDVIYVQAVKSDLIVQLSRFADDEETGFELDADGYLGRDFDAN
jgi:hypothetical protein